jgi:hypothetical protein
MVESTAWIFFIFWPSKIRASWTSIISSLSPAWCRISSGRCHHATAPCHPSFPLNQDELDVSSSSSSNPSSCRLPSQAKTEALNPHHHNKPPSSDYPTPTLYCYKKITSTVATLPNTQSRLHFASSLTRAPCQWSSTCHHYFLSPLSHAHHLSTQWLTRWWASQPTFAS